MRTGTLQRRLDIDAIARSRRRLPYWIQLDGLGSPNFDFYRELLELIKRAPEFPRLGHQGKFVESNFGIDCFFCPYARAHARAHRGQKKQSRVNIRAAPAGPDAHREAAP